MKEGSAFLKEKRYEGASVLLWPKMNGNSASHEYNNKRLPTAEITTDVSVASE